MLLISSYDADLNTPSRFPISNGVLLRLMPMVFVLIWSTGFIVAKFGLPHAPPLTFLSIRYVLSIVCFLVWIKLVGAVWPAERIQKWHLGVSGILVHAGYLGGVWVAVKHGMGSGLVALLVGFQPILTALWLSCSTKNAGGAGHTGKLINNSVSKRQWLGLLLGLAGLVLVLARKFNDTSEVTALTLGAAIVALLSITVGTLYQKQYVQPTDVRTANVLQLMAALVVTLPLCFLESETIVWNGAFLASMAWAVLVLTLGGSSLMFMLIQRGAATSVTSLLYLVPPATALLAWVLFNESITLVTLMGIGLTAMGVSLVVRAKPIIPKAVAQRP